MSQAHIEHFYGKAMTDPGIVSAIAAGNPQSPDEFVAGAVKVGKLHGYEFTAAEAHAWIKTQQELKAKGELSDSQLEGVAGGKGTSTSSNLHKQSNEAFDAAGKTGSLGEAFKGVGYQIGSWLTSW